MTSQSISRRDRELTASNELADEIEAVSQSMAERILGRAVDLDAAAKAEAEAAAATIDYDTLKDIALEVGISEDALKKALLEEMDTDKDHKASPAERLTVPDTVRGGILVSGGADRLAERLERLIEDARQSGFEMTAQHSQDRHLVEVNTKMTKVRRRAWVWIIALLVLGPTLAQAAGAAIILGIFALGVVGVVSWVKRIGRKARRAVNRALNSVLDENNPDPDSWLDLWERARR